MVPDSTTKLQNPKRQDEGSSHKKPISPDVRRGYTPPKPAPEPNPLPKPPPPTPKPKK